MQNIRVGWLNLPKQNTRWAKQMMNLFSKEQINNLYREDNEKKCIFLAKWTQKRKENGKKQRKKIK